MKEVIIIFMIVVILSSSACIENSNEPIAPIQRKINMVTMRNANMSFLEISNINITRATQELKEKNYTIIEAKENESGYYSIIVSDTVDDGRFRRNYLYLAGHTEPGEFLYEYQIVSGFTPPQHKTNETVVKEYMIETANEFAEICNVTIPWNKTTWHVIYSDYD